MSSFGCRLTIESSSCISALCRARSKSCLTFSSYMVGLRAGSRARRRHCWSADTSIRFRFQLEHLVGIDVDDAGLLEVDLVRLIAVVEMDMAVQLIRGMDVSQEPPQRFEPPMRGILSVIDVSWRRVGNQKVDRAPVPQAVPE